MAQSIEQIQKALGDRYTVERELGRGGMATVYLANDGKHNRNVAIKVLHPELAVTLGVDRFLLEIEIAARLQHPHIVPLFDSGQAEGFIFYVMPFIEGESLADRIKREGALPIQEAIRYVSEVASALDYAHSREIVHRDIKPANIMLSGGHAMVADFGIARAISASGSEGITQAGTSVGTAAYMSPEQATGSADEVDGRSDIYSLGAVLFEMLAGEPLHSGKTLQAIIASTITGEVPAIRKKRAEVSGQVEAALSKSLAKDPDDRFATARAFEESLHGTAVASGGGFKSALVGGLVVAVLAVLTAVFWPSGDAAVDSEAEVIAVVPFRTTGSGVEYLAEGMVDLLSANINGVGGIRTVDPRTVLHRWNKRADGGSLDLEGSLSVGRDVNAGSVLLGSVVSAGSQGVTMRAELLSARDGSMLGTAEVNGSGDSILSLVDSLSLALVRNVWQSREPLPSFRVSSVTTGSLDAIREYLAGESYYRRSQWDSALVHFEAAIEIDSTFAMALMRAGLSNGWMAAQGGNHQQLANEYSEAALRHSHRLGERERLFISGNRLRAQGSIESIDTMRHYVNLYPDDAEGWFNLADAMHHGKSIMGLTPEEEFDAFDRVLELDSSMTPALIHPLEQAVSYGDTARFRRYVEVARQAGAGSQLANYVNEADRILGPSAYTSTEIGEFLQTDPSYFNNLYESAVITGQVAPDTILKALTVALDTLPMASKGNTYQAVSATYLATGRIDSVLAMYDEYASGPLRGFAVFSRAVLYVLGYPDIELPPDAIELFANVDPNTNPNGGMIVAAVGLYEGDLERYREVVDAIDTTTAPGADNYDDGWRGLLQAYEGWATIVQGDTARGLARMDSGLRRIGWSHAALFVGFSANYARARAMANYAPTRDEGINRLLYDDVLRRSTVTPVLDAARALRDAGRREEAARQYSWFLELWKNADESQQPLMDQIREELAGVTGEPLQSN